MLQSLWKSNSAVTNYNTDTAFQDLVKYNQMLHPDKQLLYAGASNSVSNHVLDVLTSLDSPYFPEEPVPYVVFYHVPVNANGVADANVEIAEAVNAFAQHEVFQYISTALARPRSLFKLVKIRDTYVAFFSQRGHAYRALLGVMLIEQKQDMAMVQRITSAIQKDEPYAFTAEERVLIRQYEQELRRDQITTQMRAAFEATIFRSNDYGLRIQSLKAKIEEVFLKLEQYQEQLNNYMFRQYLIDNNLDGNSVFAETIEYLLQTRFSNIHYAYVSSGQLVLGVWSYLVLTTEANDYIRAAKSNSSHPLYRWSKQIKLLEDVIAGNLRIQITGSYQIYRNDANQWTISGVPPSRASEFGRIDLLNYHITEFNCFSSGRARMVKALNNNDYISFFEQLFETTSSVNVYDSTVMRPFIDGLKNISPSTPLQVRTPEGWVNLTLEEYYETYAPGN